MFWIFGFILSWGLWLTFADKKRWREIFPVTIFSSWISFAVEAYMHYVSELWSYSGQTITPLLGNAFGIYIVVPYFFIQWLPKQKDFKTLVTYFFLWTSFAIIFEFVHWYFLQIEYHQWWNIGCSYLSDWVLFWVFFKYYEISRFNKLSD